MVRRDDLGRSPRRRLQGRRLPGWDAAVALQPFVDDERRSIHDAVTHDLPDIPHLPMAASPRMEDAARQPVGEDL
ncbi:MAG: hypothetical protein M0Z66_07845 [Thermaerobacter sp.]|nr:hypothetical protein [Thermaerobacter sp.]